MGDYIYANGVVSALSNKLISKDVYARMIDSQSSVEALNVLQETAFGQGANISSPFEIEELLKIESKKFVDFVKTESPDRQITSLFLLPLDYNNIAGICKAIILMQEPDNFVEEEGFFEISKIKDIISTKKYGEFKNKFIEECLLEFENLATSNLIKGWQVDYLFKKYLFKNLKEIAKSNAIVKKIVDIKIDIENISVCMRAKNQVELKQQKLDYSTLTDTQLIKIMNKDRSVLDEIKDTVLKKFVTLAIIESENSIEKLEKLKNTFVFSILKNNKYKIDGAEPFVLYCYIRQNQIRNVRLIMSLKNNNLTEKIKKRFLESE